MKTPEELNTSLNKLLGTSKCNYLYAVSLKKINCTKNLQVRHYTEPGYCLEIITYDFNYWDKHGEFPIKEIFNTKDPQEMYDEIKKRFKNRKNQ